MAVPKKRTGKKAQATRRANWKASNPATSKCSNCGELTLAHTVCTACGYYKNTPVRLADKAALLKPTAKKAPKVEDSISKAMKTIEAVSEAKSDSISEEKAAEKKVKSAKAKAANKTETSDTIKKVEKKPQTPKKSTKKSEE
jgi:large subunit ribosomal protein L32